MATCVSQPIGREFDFIMSFVVCVMKKVFATGFSLTKGK
jgi:hypothetical protein